jgi:G3E family GTPase
MAAKIAPLTRDRLPVPVHILGGFLGTGKTTTIRAQLAARPGERVAVIVNDFGEAGLDATTLEGSAPYKLTSIPGGCVCCTAPEGFVAALGAVLAEAPDRVWIEPTGLARPQDLVDTIRRSPHQDAVEIAPVVVLVDPARLGAATSESERELIAQQIGIADVLVANRTDLCSDDALVRFDALVAGLWPGPLAVHRTTHGRLPKQALEWPPGEGARLPRAAAHEHAHPQEIASSAGYAAKSLRWSPDRVFSHERLARAALRASQGLAGAPLARLKGIFRTQEGALLLEVAGGSLHEERSHHRRDSRADLIFEGSDAGGAAERLADWLEGAALTERERGARAEEIELALPDGRVRIVRRSELMALPGGIDDVAKLVPKRSGAAARVAALLDAYEVPASGSAVLCAADGFASEPVPLSALRAGLLVHSQGDAALPREQGGPFRLLIPDGTPGAPSACSNVKAVTRIVVKSA